MKLKRKSSSSQFSGYHIYVNREILPLNINTTYTHVFSRKFLAAKIAICNLYKASIFRFQQDDFILSFFFPTHSCQLSRLLLHIFLSYTNAFVLWSTEFHRVLCVHHRGLETTENDSFPSRISQKPLVQQGAPPSLMAACWLGPLHLVTTAVSLSSQWLHSTHMFTCSPSVFLRMLSFI